MSGPGEEVASFAAADSVPQDIVKRHLEARPKEAGRPFSPPWVPKKRAPEAEPKDVDPSFAVVELPERLAPRFSKARKESEFHLTK